MKKIAAIILFVSAASFVACQNHSKNSTSINEKISVDDFEKKLSENKDVQLIDVRTPEEYAEGHLKGALNMNINGDDFDAQLKTLNKSKPVLVYCLSGGRSGNAADKMGDLGFSEVYNMDGGIMKWNASNKPTESGAFSAQSLGMSMDEFNGHLKTDKYVLVDFNAKWCEPCKKIAPMLDALADKKKDKLILLKVDADENKDLLNKKGIDGIPLLELYKDGKLIWKHQGLIDEETLLKETQL